MHWPHGCSRMRRAWDEGFTFIFETTSTKAQRLQFFPGGRVLATGKEGAASPRSGCRHSCINPVTRVTQFVALPKILDIQAAHCLSVDLTIQCVFRTAIFCKTPQRPSSNTPSRILSRGLSGSASIQIGFRSFCGSGC